jgi:hypothetical protein
MFCHQGGEKGMSLFTIAGPPPRIDGRREFRGRPQLSIRDLTILDHGKREGIRISHESGETVFYCGSRKLPRQAVLRLCQLGYLISARDGLLEGMPQTLLVNDARSTIGHGRMIGLGPKARAPPSSYKS